MRQQRGFTLVEVLVAVSLLSIIMVALGSAMRTIAQTEVRVDQRVQRMDDMRVTVRLLRQVVGRVSGRKMPAQDATGGQVVPFRATRTSLEWVGIMPARPGVGGRYFFRLQLENGSAGPGLVLRYLPWSPETPKLPDWSLASSVVMGHGISGMEVQAEGRPPPGRGQGADAWPRGWVAGWPVAEHLPERVRILLADEAGPWPPIVITVFALGQGAGTGDGFTLGGT